MPNNTKVTANISDLHQPASMQMNRRNLLIKFTFFVSQESSQDAITSDLETWCISGDIPKHRTPLYESLFVLHGRTTS